MTASVTSRAPSPLFTHLLPSMVLAIFATVLFWWKPFSPPLPATVHIVLKSDQSGKAQFLFNIDGVGLHRDVTQPVEGGGQWQHVQFVIPAGKLCDFVLTALDRPATVQVQRCWITAGSGEVLALISPKQIMGSLGQAATPTPEGFVQFPTLVEDKLIGLSMKLQPPLDLAVNVPPPGWQILAVFGGTLGGCVLLSMLAERHRPRWQSWWSAGAAWAVANPCRVIFLAALLSVSICAFPVIFGGKSYISPNNGMALVYGKFPTMPGAPVELDENATGSDIGATMYWHLPSSVIEHRAIFEDGEFPLWTRYTWCGVTYFGQLFTAIGDPFHWLPVLSGGAPWAWDAKFLIAKTLFALGIGLLVLRTSRSLPVALLLTLSAPYIGFFAYRFCHVANFAVCYAPWILLAWVEGARAPTLRRAVPWAAVLLLADWCQLNSGTAKEAIGFLSFLNGAGALALVSTRESWRWKFARLGLFFWASFLFVLLSAPLWMVFLDSLQKAWTAYDRPQIYQIQPALAIGLFDDMFYRQLTGLEFLMNPSANFLVLLGCAWALTRLRALVSEAWFLPVVVMTVLAASFAFGVVPPSFLAKIPLVKSIYHYDNTFSCVLFVLLFVIAGFGLRECLTRMPSPQFRGDWILVLVFVAILLGGYFGFTQATHRIGRTFLAVGEKLPKSGFFAAYATALVLSMACLPWTWREALLNRRAGPAWAAVTICLFGVLHFRHGAYFETKFDQYTMNPKSRYDLRHVTSPALDTVRREMTEPSRVVGLDWEMSPGFNTMLGLESISGPDALMNPAMLSLAEVLGIPRFGDWRLFVSTARYDRVHRSLDFLNVRYLLVDPTKPELPAIRRVAALDQTVYESETAWPRAFFTDAVAAYGDLRQLNDLVQNGDGRPFAALRSSARLQLPVAKSDLAGRTVVRAGNYRLTNNTTSFSVDAPTAGLAVLMESDAPGDMRAFLDGRPVPCITVNHAFRGVHIAQPGVHEVKFAYWPKVLGPALWVAGVGIVALLASLVIMWKSGSGRSGTLSAKSDSSCPTP